MGTLSWGNIAPEIALTADREYIHVYHPDLSSEEKIARITRFIAGRLNYYENFLPPDPIHYIQIHIGEQTICDETREKMTKELRSKYSGTTSLRISFLKD